MSVPIQIRKQPKELGSEGALYFYVVSRSWAIGAILTWLVPVLLFLPFSIIFYSATWVTFKWMILSLFLGIPAAMLAGFPVWLAIRVPLMAIGVGPRVAMAITVVPVLWAGLMMFVWISGFDWFPVPGGRTSDPVPDFLLILAIPIGLVVALRAAFDPVFFPEAPK